jgi:hypothetical protein
MSQCPILTPILRGFLTRFWTVALDSTPRIYSHRMSCTPSNASGEQGIILLQVHTALYFSLLILHPIQAMIFLKENTLLKRELSHDDIKPRLLGHWGTCPGLVLIYAHLNRVIRMTGQDMLYVVGPGTWMVFTLLRKPSSESFSRTRCSRYPGMPLARKFAFCLLSSIQSR